MTADKNEMLEGYTLITPELASSWLTKNVANRAISGRHVKQLVNKIKEGKWQKNTTDAIGFFEDGTLANGQHRLMAIAKAGIPVYARVIFDIPCDAAIAIDSSKARTACDAIKIVTGETFYTSKISKMVTIASGKSNWSHEDHLKVSLKYTDSLKLIKSMFEGLPKVLQSTSLMASIYTAYMSGIDEKQLRRFLEVLSTCRAETEVEDSIVMFRNLLNNEYFTSSGRRRHDYAWELRRCQNVIFNYVCGRRIAHFVVPKDFRYPLINFDLS